MMPSQEEALRVKKRVPPNTNEEQRWNEIYVVLFPESTPDSLPTPCTCRFRLFAVLSPPPLPTQIPSPPFRHRADFVTLQSTRTTPRHHRRPNPGAHVRPGPRRRRRLLRGRARTATPGSARRPTTSGIWAAASRRGSGGSWRGRCGGSLGSSGPRSRRGGSWTWCRRCRCGCSGSSSRRRGIWGWGGMVMGEAVWVGGWRLETSCIRGTRRE